MPLFGKKLQAIMLTKKYNIDKHKKDYYINVKSTANYVKQEEKKYYMDQSMPLANQDIKYRRQQQAKADFEQFQQMNNQIMGNRNGIETFDIESGQKEGVELGQNINQNFGQNEQNQPAMQGQ